MKGIIFTEFLEMVEGKFSPELADEIIRISDLPSKGIYTSVGTYDHNEFATLMFALSEKEGIAPATLTREFGSYLFSRFAILYPRFFQNKTTAYDFLEQVEGFIHVEVRKLYPDAQLPRFAIARPTPAQLIMEYRSERGLHDLAEGLIQGCVQYFGEEISLQKEDQSGGNGSCVRFVLNKKPSYERS